MGSDQSKKFIHVGFEIGLLLKGIDGLLEIIGGGAIKLILILLLWKKKLWAYPLSILFLVLFIIYQIYRYTFTHSASMILLTLLDVAMIILTFLEYKRIRSGFHKNV